MRLILIYIIILLLTGCENLPIPYDLDDSAYNNDASFGYLALIFGKVGNLPNGGAENHIFSQLMGILNNIAFSIALLIAFYTIFISTIRTAHQGSIMGKKWSILWTPFRAVVGICLLIPSKSGYSYIQVILMWAILQSIAAANSIWNMAIDFYDRGIPVNRALKNGPQNSDINTDVSNRAREKGWIYAGNHYRLLVSNSSDQRDKFEPDKEKVSIFRNDKVVTIPVDMSVIPLWGVFEYVILDPLRLFINFILTMVSGQDPCPMKIPILYDIANIKFCPLPFVNFCGFFCGSCCCFKPLSKIVSIVMSFLWKIVSFFFDDGLIELIVRMFDLGCPGEDLSKVIFGKLDDFINLIPMFQFITNLPQLIQHHVSDPNHDVLLNLNWLGSDLTSYAEDTFFAIVVAVITILVFFGAASGMSSIPHMIKAVLSFLMPVFVIAVVLFWGMGITLLIYVPLIPYIVFLFASLGWLILVIEAIVAAPLISLLFVLPADDEMGKVGHPLIILLGLLLRPALMVVGFIFGIKIVNISIHILTRGFGIFSENMGGMYYGVFGMFAFALLYVALVTSIVHQSFSLIYKVPDRVLRWIGGSPEDTNFAGQQAKGLSKNVESGAQIGKSAMTASSSKVSESLKPKKKGNQGGGSDGAKGGGAKGTGPKSF